MSTVKWLLVWLVGVVILVTGSTAQANLRVEIDKTGKPNYVLYLGVSIVNNLYVDLFNALDQAKEGEEVHIIIRNNRGGAVPTMDMIRDRIKKSKGRVIISVEGYAASAAAHLSMQGDVTYLPYDARLLWHTGAVCFGPGMCIRLTPFLQFWDKRLYDYYERSVERDRWIYNPGIICARPNMCMENPFSRTFVSKEYWEFFKTGYDEWVSGREVCQNIGGWTKQDINGTKYCIIKGLK